ncbi:MAG: CPBP family intramembrane metalloprotease [Candidatus Aceula meridiana]|nr:CPBP family intramembrane metalloprotease [Candidatus Aceula meridiana]
MLGFFIFLPEQTASIFGELTGQHPLFFLSVYTPAIAAFMIVGYFGGYRGLKGFLSRFLLWRCSRAWYVFLMIGIPLIFYVGALIKGSLFLETFPFASFSLLVTAFVFATIKGPVEEFGWRGLALPLLQRKLAPVWAGLVLGVVWGFWHLPAFFLSGTQQSQWSFFAFFFGCIAISVIATGLFNASKGSILLPALFHFMLMNPIFPDAQPYDTYLLIVVAIVIVGIKRKEMFSKEGAVTKVIEVS